MPVLAITDCQTADDVRAAAKAVVERRRLREARLRQAAKAQGQPPAAPPVPHRAVPNGPPSLWYVPHDDLVRFIKGRRAIVEGILRELLRPGEPELKPAPRLIDIQKAVCEKFQITLTDLHSKCRFKKYADPRLVSYCLCRALTTHGFPAIGRAHGDRDHSTILHGTRKMQWLRDKLEAELSRDDPIEIWAERAHYHFLVHITSPKEKT